MAAEASAIQDLRFGLSFAASTYRRYAERVDYNIAAGLMLELADERDDDADAIAVAADIAQLPRVEPTLDEQTAGPLLGMGAGDPYDAASAMYRVQRAENSLGRMAAQLRSMVPNETVGEVLSAVVHRIGRRKEDVRAMRRRVRRGYEFGQKAAAMPLPDVDGQSVTIWFGTNRTGDAVLGFAGARAEHTCYGRCSVFVPRNRRIGSLGRGLVGRILHGDDRIKVEGIRVLSESTFWSAMAQEVRALDSNERQALVFLHGYCTKFDDAARRTAQLKIDLGHNGPAAFFSWPSLGYPIGYTGDEAAIEGSEAAIEKFLVDFATRSGADSVHIIAHSMGNRGLLRALNAIASAAAQNSPIRFGQIFLAAPDVDTQLFSNLAAAYARLAARTTLYVTDNDRAIGLSRRLHAYPRVGLAPPIVVLPGIDTIDASGVNLEMVGHSYAAGMRPVLADIYELMRKGTPPNGRFGLRKESTAGAVHWKFAR